MTDMENVPPPPMPEPAPALPPAPRPPARNGCLTAFMLLVGIILLLPGVCALFFGFATLSSSSSEPIVKMLVATGLLVAAGGVFLIWAAIRGARR